MNRRNRSVLALAILAFLVIFVPLLRSPHQIPVTLSGQSTLKVVADRATISLEVSSHGSKQRKVADEVQQTTEEILNLLRPLTLPPNRTTTASNKPNTNPKKPPQPLPSDFLPPLATLSVNAFTSSSYYSPSIIGETKTYTSSLTITAEFRAISPLLTNSSTITTTTSTSTTGNPFHHLSLILPPLAKLPRTKISSLKWHLYPPTLSTQQSLSRHKAMAEALQKAADYTSPLPLSFPSTTLVSFSERPRQGRYSYEHHFRVPEADAMMYRPRSRLASMAARRGYSALKDENGDGGVAMRYLDDTYDQLILGDDVSGYAEEEVLSYEYGYDIEGGDEGDGGGEAVFGLEPQVIEVASEVVADFVVVERGVVRGVMGWLGGWVGLKGREGK